MPKPLEIGDFGFGLMTKLSPTEMPPGAAMVSLDCDYNTRNIANRRGYAAVLENGPGAAKIADFEIGESWSGGAPDTVNFIVPEAAADGKRGRSLVATAGGGESAMTLTLVTLAAGDFIALYLLGDDALYHWITVIGGVLTDAVQLVSPPAGASVFSSIWILGDDALYHQFKVIGGIFDDFAQQAGNPGGSNVFIDIHIQGDDALFYGFDVLGGVLTNYEQVTSVPAVGSPLNLGTDPLDVIHCWIMTTAMSAGITGYTLALTFQSAGGSYKATIASGGDPRNLLELNLSKYARIRRQEFVKTGNPTWTAITDIRIGLTVTSGTGTLAVTVDNLNWTPGLMQDLFQFRRESGQFAGATGYYAVAGGVLYRSDGRRWVSVFSGFDRLAPVNSHTVQNRRIMTDGITTPRVLQDDGSTVYRLGIVTPPKTMSAQQLAGGGLPDGSYFAQVLFYSTKTGGFSAPDDRNPTTPIIAITGGGGAAGIQFKNIPVSADPQVDWVVIGIRPSTEPELFFRASDGLFGEVPNGTTTFEFSDNLATLLARSLTAIDPDLDYPSVINAATGQPVEAHPLFIEEAGGYVLSVMAEQPTVVRVSRFRQYGSWALDDEFPLGENDQEPITGIAVSASHIIAMKKDAVYPGRVVGGDDKIVFDPPISDRGAVSHRAMWVVGSVLFYRGMDGVYALPPTMLAVKISDYAQPTWRELWDPYGVGREAAVAIRDTEHVIFFGRSLSALRNDIGWVTHYRTVAVRGQAPDKFPTWAPTLWRMPADVACEVRPQATDGSGWEAWIGGIGQVFRLNYGVQDDGRALRMQHRMALVSPDPSMAHLFRFVDIEAFCSGAFNMAVSPYLGTAIVADSSPSVPLQGNADVLPFVLGTGILGAPKYVAQRISLPVRAARYLSLDFSVTARAKVEIYRVRPLSQPLGRRRFAA